MTTLEQVMETTRTLPLEDRQRLQLFLQEGLQEQERLLEQPDAAALAREVKLRQELDEYRRAKQWIAEHRAEYLGQWVVLAGDRLISHGFDGHRVAAEARADGIEVPFLVQIIEEPAAYCGAWL